jgi:hypothetical protein
MCLVLILTCNQHSPWNSCRRWWRLAVECPLPFSLLFVQLCCALAADYPSLTPGNTVQNIAKQCLKLEDPYETEGQKISRVRLRAPLHSFKGTCQTLLPLLLFCILQFEQHRRCSSEETSGRNSSLSLQPGQQIHVRMGPQKASFSPESVLPICILTVNAFCSSKCINNVLERLDICFLLFIHAKSAIRISL